MVTYSIHHKRTYPINNLPNELLSYVFQLGVKIEQEELDEVSEFSKLTGNHWQGVDDDQDSDRASVNTSDSISSRVLSVVTDSDLEDDQVQHRDILPFQVLVSHMC